jgi:ABC-type multidrug transport system fused ATPase/permease subunit
VRVWQPGSHLMHQRGAEVDDWSWRRTRRRLGMLIRFTRPYRTRTLFSIGSLLLATAFALAPPLLSKYAVDDGIRQHDLGKLWWIVGAFLVFGLLSWGMSYVQTYLTGWVGERILADLRNSLFDHLQDLSLGFYERNRAGVIISRLTNDVEAIDQLVTDGVTSLVQNTLTLVGTAILLFILDWRLALATLIVIPFMSVATAIFRKRSARAYASVRERLGLVTATLAEDIAGMRIVQAFTREQANTRNFRTVTERYREANMETVVLNGLYFPFVDLLSTVALAVVLGYGGHLYFQGAVTLGTLFAFMLYVQNFFDPVQQLSQLYGTFLSATAALDKIVDVLDQEPEVVDLPGTLELPPVEGNVAFESVRFGYGDGPEVLHGLDLEVPAGTTVALVGHTGAGKSTIAKLLARFYDPREGRITIDGHDLREVTQASLRRQLGIVPQEGFLFAGTVRDNIAFGRPDASP